MIDRKPTLCVVAGPNGSGRLLLRSSCLTTSGLRIACTSDPAINVARITQRYLNGGHEVPISKVISRYYKSLVNATKAISFVDRAYVYDNSIDNQLPRLLYRTTEGQLFKQYVEDIPEWAGMLVK